MEQADWGGSLVVDSDAYNGHKGQKPGYFRLYGPGDGAEASEITGWQFRGLPYDFVLDALGIRGRLLGMGLEQVYRGNYELTVDCHGSALAPPQKLKAAREPLSPEHLPRSQSGVSVVALHVSRALDEVHALEPAERIRIHVEAVSGDSEQAAYGCRKRIQELETEIMGATAKLNSIDNLVIAPLGREEAGELARFVNSSLEQVLEMKTGFFGAGKYLEAVKKAILLAQGYVGIKERMLNVRVQLAQEAMVEQNMTEETAQLLAESTLCYERLQQPGKFDIAQAQVMIGHLEAHNEKLQATVDKNSYLGIDSRDSLRSTFNTLITFNYRLGKLLQQLDTLEPGVWGTGGKRIYEEVQGLISECMANLPGHNA